MTINIQQPGNAKAPATTAQITQIKADLQIPTLAAGTNVTITGTVANPIINSTGNSSTLVPYSLTIPLDGNKYSADHTFTVNETLIPGTGVEGSSYFVNFPPSAYTPNVSAFKMIGSTTYDGTHLMQGVFGYARGPQLVWLDLGAVVAPPSFTAQSAPGGNVNSSYSYSFVATGAVSYAVASGSLPAGLSLNTSTGALTGTPTTAAAYTFVISATNTGGTTNSTSQSVTIAIALPVFTAQSAPAGTVGAAYSYTFVATGATSYSVFSGALPTGLSLNTGTGAVTGTPTVAAGYTFVIRATNAGGNTNSTSQSVTISTAIIASDTFTGTNGTLLSAHTSDSGHTWSVNTYGGSTLPAHTIQSNKLSLVSNSSADYLFASISATPPTADYTNKMAIQNVPNAYIGFVGPMIRSNGASNNYFALMATNNNDISVYKTNTIGGVSLIGTGTPSSPALNGTDTYTLTLSGVGTTISLIVQRSSDSFYLAPAGTWQAGSVAYVSVTDSTVTAAGKAGFAIFDNPAITGCLIDNVLTF